MRSTIRAFPLTAFFLAALTTGIGIRAATYVAWGTDAAGYVGAARRWATGEIYRPSPVELWAPWADLGPISAATPLAYNHAIRGTDLSIYPLGFPVFLAVADTLNRELGVYLVPPLFGGLIVWCAYLMARRIDGEGAGLLAAILLASSPLTLSYLITPMSDVPAAAFFMLALEMSLRPSQMSGAASGAAMAAAVMIRPVLAPLSIVPIAAAFMLDCPLLVWRSWHWRRALIVSAMAAAGGLLVGWSQQEFYGGFFRSGYPGQDVFFRLAHIPMNVRFYSKNLIALHTPVVLLALVAGVAMLATRGARDIGGRIVVALLATILLNFALYLPYLPYDDVAYLRFLFPAIAAMFILLAAGTAAAMRVAAHLWRPAALLALVPAAIVIGGARSFYPPVFAAAEAQHQVRVMGRYLRETLPPNAAVLSYLHSAALASYTGRQIIRFDLIQPENFEATVLSLQRHGYRPSIVVDEQMERLFYKLRFQNTPYERLDWQPRAQFVGGTTIWYLEFADREPGGRPVPPIDVLR